MNKKIIVIVSVFLLINISNIATAVTLKQENNESIYDSDDSFDNSECKIYYKNDYKVKVLKNEKGEKFTNSDGFVSEFFNNEENLFPQLCDSDNFEYSGFSDEKIFVAPSIPNSISKGSSLCPASSKKVFYVGGTGENNYSSIQSAIDDATEGDTVFVYDDSAPYFEHIDITKSISLIGENKESTIINGKRLDMTKDNIIVWADNVFIQGFNLTKNNGYYYTAAVKLYSDFVTITDCSFYLNSWIGIYLYNADNCLVKNCYFYGNLEAILMKYSNYNEITNNDFYFNADGIMLFVQDHYNIIKDCTLTKNSYLGIHIQFSEGNKVLNCELDDCSEPLGLYSAPYTVFQNNKMTNCQNNIGIAGASISDYNAIDMDTTNTIDGKPTYYIIGSDEQLIIDDSWDIVYLALVECSNVIIKNIKISDNAYGLTIAGVTDSHIIDCDFRDNEWSGIFCFSCSNNEITNNDFRGCISGILLEEGSNHNIITGNNIKNNIGNGIDLRESNYNYIDNHEIFASDGINLFNSAFNTIKNSIMYDCGIDIRGSTLEHFTNYVDTTNKVNDRPVYYLRDKTAEQIPDDAAQIILSNCNDFTISNFEFNNIAEPIIIAFSSNNEISNNEFNDVYVGIFLRGQNNNYNTITDNTFSNSGFGVVIKCSEENTVQNNDFTDVMLCVRLDKAEQNHILDNTITNSYYGIYVEGSTNNEIKANTVDNNNDGLSAIYLIFSKNNVLKDNIMTGCGLIIYSEIVEEYIHDIDTSNKVNGKPVYYYVNKVDFVVPSGAGQIILVNCEGCSISSYILSEATAAVSLAFSNNNIISKNIFSEFSFAGIYLDMYCNDNQIYCNSLKSNGYGVYIQCGTNNVIKDNKLNENLNGVYFHNSVDNEIISNNFNKNNLAVYLSEDCSKNKIYHNNFFNFLYKLSVSAAYDEMNKDNSWDNGKKGNYWGNYRELYPDAKRNGTVWDTPYQIYGGASADNYPLVTRFIQSRDRMEIADLLKSKFVELFQSFYSLIQLFVKN